MRVDCINNYKVNSYYYKNTKNVQNTLGYVNFKSNKISPVVNNKLKNFYQASKECLKGLALLALAGLFTLTFSKRWETAKKDLGYVEPLQEKFETKKDAIDYAITRIVDPLNMKDAYEYSVLLDYEDYSVISERKGDSTSVGNYPLIHIIKDQLNIKHPYIALHGHPEELFRDRLATQTFSFQDFRVLNSDENRMETFVVKKDKRFCILRKKEGFKQLSEEELKPLEEKFEEAFRYSWANPVEVYKNDTLIHTFHDYQGMHRFWKEVADEYNLEYYTNYGVYEGVDAYSEYYYPELMTPMAPTSHKDFKL